MKTEQISFSVLTTSVILTYQIETYQTPLESRVYRLKFRYIRSKVSCRSPSGDGHPDKCPVVLESDFWPSDATFTM